MTATTSYGASAVWPAAIRLAMFDPVPEIRTATRVLATDMGGSRVKEGATAMRPRKRLSKGEGVAKGRGASPPNDCR
ncbi:hypothetical protein GCM10009434_13370 [Brevundimonas olei]